MRTARQYFFWRYERGSCRPICRPRRSEYRRFERNPAFANARFNFRSFVNRCDEGCNRAVFLFILSFLVFFMSAVESYEQTSIPQASFVLTFQGSPRTDQRTLFSFSSCYPKLKASSPTCKDLFEIVEACLQPLSRKFLRSFFLAVPRIIPHH